MVGETMPGQVSKEQIARAKEIGIEDYILTHEPDNVKRIGSAYYLRDHDSLEISNNLWNWHSHGVGGKNVVDYLVKVRGYGFVDAVRALAGDNGEKPIPPKARPPTGKKQADRVPFRLPPRYRDNARVIAYLQERGIDEPLILDCIERGILYESAPWHNAVFIGRDEYGKARFATLRGTARLAEDQPGGFKRDADGSDKRFGFYLPPDERGCKTVIVFESPTDALSHKVLFPETDGYRLSLGGTSLAALTHFLETHPEITHCVACSDNDEAGEQAAAKIAGLPDITVTRSAPPSGKDWNDTLKSIGNEVKQWLLLSAFGIKKRGTVFKFSPPRGFVRLLYYPSFARLPVKC
jgi:hypothetical protein